MVSWVTVLCSVALVLSRLKHTWCVSADDFLPYGTEHGDSDLEHATVNVPLPQSFTFLGETFSAVHVSINGALTWGSAPGESAVTPMQDVKLIAPYFGDVDATYGGNVFYRSTNDSALLERVSAIITANFDGLSEGLPLSSLFIATWHRIPANGGPVDKHNTFQCVLAYNAQSGSGSESDSPGPRVVSDPMSFALFLYEDGGIQWSRGQGENAKHAQVGFSNGNGRYLILPTSRTDAVLEVAATGNTGVVGQWLFRVDGAQVVLPGMNRPLLGKTN